MRGGDHGLELLLVRRTTAARFMAGHWVFPGGAVDPEDGEGQPGLRAAAVRELAEEAGVVLEQEAELVPFARWITPEQSPIRFDTWFYLASAPADAEPRGRRGGDRRAVRWLTPAQALAEHAAGQFELAFPPRGSSSSSACSGQPRNCSITLARDGMRSGLFSRGSSARAKKPASCCPDAGASALSRTLRRRSRAAPS